ncbi:glycosyltransferase 87 family protein, partial [Tritonibacter sp. SIMBA_163]|uniref:glycosyltransferase 87 family protein n=1 Tax=Tritonibacter sp. SIMBA_163 TaxID=3080868 RepID=UPI003980149D
LGGLLLAPTRSLLGGLLLGLLTVKPHLGILVPFCLVAAGNYRAVASATFVSVAMVVLSGVLFGSEIWPLFFSETNPMM